MATQTTISVQQTQASTYNHPCGDLLENGTRSDYLDIIVPLYRASIRGDCEAARIILDSHRHLVRYSITENKETPLHVSTASSSTEFVKYLVNMMEVADLELRNRDGNTAFCLAAIAGNVGMAKIMVECNPALPNIRGSDNMMPLYLAAFHGNHAMVTYLYNQPCSMDDVYWTNDMRDEVLVKCIEADIFDVGLRILKDHMELPQDKNLWVVLHTLAQKPKAFLAGTRLPNMKLIVFHPSDDHTFGFLSTWLLLFGFLLRVLAFIGLVEIQVVSESNAKPLLRLIWKRTMEKPKDIIDDILKGPMTQMGTYPSHVLFVAARMNNSKFLVELIREYPDLIWMRSEDGESIFHISVSHRYKNIYNLIYEIGSMKDLIATMTDQKGNNILHLVGMNPEKNLFEDLLAAPFKLQRELLWYKEVSTIVPPHCRNVKNTAGQTPKDIFIENHKDLISQSEKWIKETINQSMVVATLVAAVGFSVAISIPGGYDQNKGFPLLLKNKLFICFIISDALSFFLSSISILIFLSISVSRHTYNDFRDMVPSRLYVGHFTLVLSIAFLIGAFLFNFITMYGHKYKPLVILTAFAILYIALKLIVFTSLIESTYFGNNPFMFKKKHALYYKTHRTK